MWTSGYWKQKLMIYRDRLDQSPKSTSYVGRQAGNGPSLCRIKTWTEDLLPAKSLVCGARAQWHVVACMVARLSRNRAGRNFTLPSGTQQDKQ